MRISERGIALIKRFEGFSPTAYLCPAGVWTIGYGHVIQSPVASHQSPVSEEEAERLLREDVRIAQRAVARLITVPLTQNQFDALVSFTFNLGSGALQRSTLRRVANRGEHQAALGQFHKWIYAAGKPLPGLIARRKAEAELYSEFSGL